MGAVGEVRAQAVWVWRSYVGVAATQLGVPSGAPKRTYCNRARPLACCLSLARNRPPHAHPHPLWDKADYLWEAAETFLGKKPEVMLDWHHLLAMQQTELQPTLAKVQEGSHLLLLLEEHEVQLLGRLLKAIEEVEPDGLFLGGKRADRMQAKTKCRRCTPRHVACRSQPALGYGHQTIQRHAQPEQTYHGRQTSEDGVWTATGERREAGGRGPEGRKLHGPQRQRP